MDAPREAVVKCISSFALDQVRTSPRHISTHRRQAQHCILYPVTCTVCPIAVATMDAAAIEEANKLRIANGMKPLPVPGAAAPQPSEAISDEDLSSTFEGRQSQAYDNYRQFQEAEAAKRKREERVEAIKKARELEQRNRVLEGKGLGEEDEGGDLDAKAWLKSQKKRQKKIEQAKKAEEEREKSAAAVAAARAHDARDLAGVRVGHDISTLLDDGEQVLTLKDTTILENEDEGDELENIDLRAREKLTEQLDLKKKKPVYDPSNFDETGEHSILAQYDEEISGKKKKAFTLDFQGSTAELADILGEPSEKPKVGSVSLDIIDNPVSDYLDVSEIKIKKPKKKKKSRSTRQRAVDDDDSLLPVDGSAALDDSSAMLVDSEPTTFAKKRKVVDDEFVDDDDLQATLAAQRRDALKKRKRVRPEDIARQLKEEAEAPDAGAGDAPKGLVIDEISEFVGALKKSQVDERKPRPQAQPQSMTAMDEASDDEDVEMEGAQQDSEALAPNVLEDLDTIGVDKEKTVAQGMGATLQILRERGLIKESGAGDLNDRFRDHQQFLTEKNRRLAKIDEDAKRQRERDRASGHLDRMSTRDREEYARQQNTQRDLQASKIMAELFKREYTPNFDIKYTDEHGRRLDQKDAFKHLSHQFHGKGSGKGKTDKLLKKIDAEKRREAQAMLDDSKNAGTGSTQPKQRKDAGVRLA
ncbi:hypothetical protein RB597_006036 [Gaeumannomyces tritici]